MGLICAGILATSPACSTDERGLGADRVTAFAIYAKKSECDGGRVEQTFQTGPSGDQRWEAETKGAPTLEQAEIVADVIYAKEVKCGSIDAREVHAKEIEIGDD